MKPRLYIVENGNTIDDGIEILNIKAKNVNVYYMSDGFFVVKLNNCIIRNSRKIDEIMLNKINNSLIYTNYANVIYYLFVIIFNRKNPKLLLEIYDITGDESIIVSQENNVWHKNATKGDTTGRISFNNNCFSLLNKTSYINTLEIEKNIIEDCMYELTSILDNIIDDENMLQTLLLYVNAIINIKNGHFDIGIILLWTSVEKIINDMWVNMINGSEYNYELKSKLKKSSEYVVSIKIHELFLNKEIDLELVKKLEKARKIRNKIIHGQYNLFSTKGDINGTLTNISSKCIDVNIAATELIEHVYKINFSTTFSIDTQIY